MLKNYRILEELTRTQNCKLLLAQHLESGIKVVLKSPLIQRESDLSPDEQLARFRRECDIHLYLKHESIIPVIEVFEDEGMPYLASAYMPYPTLKTLLERKTAFSPLEALNIVQQLCQALHYIHDQGVIHRDIHPQNILVTEENKIYLMDFGCSRKVFAPNITQEKVVQGSFYIQGTLYYMSPEQLLGQSDLDFRTDVFSVGVILYQLLTYQLPFEGEELEDVIQNLLEKEPHKIRSLNPYVPPALEQMVYHALRKDPDYRTPTARKFALEIETLLDDPNLYHAEARWRLKVAHSADAAQDYSLVALQKNAYHLPSLHLLGRIFVKQGALGRAQRCFERILERDETQARAHFALGQLEMEQNPAAACQHFERAWQHETQNREYRLALAKSLRQIGRKYQALEHLNLLMEQCPEWVEPFVEAAHVYNEEDQRDAALAHFRKAQELDPVHVDVLYGLATTQHELGYYNDALEVYQQLATLQPERVEVQHNLANVYYLLDELGESRRILEELLEVHQRPRSSEWEMTYRLLGFIYARLNLSEEAIEVYKYAIICRPERLENYLFLAASYREQLQLEFAIHTLKYVSELPIGEDEALVYFLLARAYFEQGKEPEAVEALERCLSCYRTLSQSMAQQVREDLSLLSHRRRERKRGSLTRFRRQKGDYARSTSMHVLSYPASKRQVV